MPKTESAVQLKDGIQEEIIEEAEDLQNVTDEAEGEDHLTKPFTISSYGADYTVDSLVKRMETESFFVPPFQRSLVWNVKQASRFIESLLMGLPVPGIFVFREAHTNRHLIVDGQQRLRTLQAFYNGIFRGAEFRLLDVRTQWLEKTYKQLDSSDKLRLDDSVIHTTIFRQDQPENNIDSIYEVFERINTGGIKLSDQEIRVCVNFGPFTELLKNLNENTYWRGLYGTKSVRLKDQELILRFLALLYDFESYSRPMRVFLNRFMEKNTNIDEMRSDEYSQRFNSSAKGRARNKRHERRPVPITGALSSMLKQEAADRARDAPLLTRADGSGWGHSRTRHHRNDFRAVIEAAGLDPDEVTLYALRHSSIVRQLLANVPIRIVATLHDTSVKMIERTYSRYIVSHSDEIARRALLEIQQPSAPNVVPLVKGR